MGEMGNAYNIFVGKSEGQRSLGRILQWIGEKQDGKVWILFI